MCTSTGCTGTMFIICIFSFGVNLMLLRCSNSWSLPKKVSILLVIRNARKALLLSQMASRRHLQVTRDCSADPVILITAGLVLLLSALLQTMEHFRVRNQ